MDFFFIFILFLISDNAASKRLNLLETRLFSLRNIIKELNVQAYIIPSEGDHNEEYTAIPDRRREYISGFTGSTGEALITQKDALLWTDSRYTLQAERELPTSWTLMKKSVNQSIEDWIKEHLNKGDNVGVDPMKVQGKLWNQRKSILATKGIELLSLEMNLVDIIWTDRPSYPPDPLIVHDLEFAGETYLSKMSRLRTAMKSIGVDVFVTSILDEIAWVTNLRGSDIPHTPVFISYLLVGTDWAKLFVKGNKITSDITEHLSNPECIVRLMPYKDFWFELKDVEQKANKIFVPSTANYAIHSKISPKKLYTATSPLLDFKAEKNDVEVRGSRKAHIRDAVALCELFYTLENEIPKGERWDELTVNDHLTKLRSLQEYNKGESFESIIAFGKNGALPHYVATIETNVEIDTSGLLTIDSGGQYLDGTIDTTRTLHFGKPSKLQISIYTSLLKGVADLATTVFPEKTRINDLEMIIKRPLLQMGLFFEHGTTHGTGVYLGVHEATSGTYHQNFIGSQEPGYYRKDAFGMRLENLVVTIPAKVRNEENEHKKLLEFSPLTLVPYEPKLIDVQQLDQSHINWINEYHDLVRLHVGDEMIKQGKQQLHKWLVNKTSPIFMSSK